MAGRNISSEKVIKAMTLNQKEDRVLAKTFGTLELERKFATNVLDLHLRAIKSNYRHLKDKVSKIRSHLTPEEIKVLRQLEQEGMIKPMTTFNLNASRKIAAAAKRLNVYPEGMQHSKSAFIDRHPKSRERDSLLPNRSNTDTNILMERRNSVVGVFIDKPSPDKIERSNSIDAKIHFPVTMRSVSAAPANMTASTNHFSMRPASSMRLERYQTSLSKISFQTSHSKHHNSQHTPFSSHEATEKEVASLAITKPPRDPKPSFITADDPLDANLGADIFEERRQELLQEEQLFYSSLLKRKTDFIDKIETYLDENPLARFDNSVNLLPFEIKQLTNTSIDKCLSDETVDGVMAHSRRRRNLKQYDFSKTYTSEEEYRKLEVELWKDMNKTRYLRLPDDRLDYSGVVTLVKDQMNLFKSIRATEVSHIVSR